MVYVVEVYGQTMVTWHEFETKEEAMRLVNIYKNSNWAYARPRFDPEKD